MDKKRIILVLLSLGFASLIVYDTGIVNRKSSNSIEDGKNHVRVSRIKARLVRKEVSTYSDAKRDIFNLLIAKQQQLSVHAIIPASMPEKMPMPPPPQPLPEAPSPPPSPTDIELFASQVKFLGFLEGSGAKTVFISKGPDVFEGPPKTSPANMLEIRLV